MSEIYDCYNCGRQLEEYECTHCEVKYDEKPTQWIPIESETKEKEEV